MVSGMVNRSDSGRGCESRRDRAGKGGDGNAGGLERYESRLGSGGGNADGQKCGMRKGEAGDARGDGKGASEPRGVWRRATAKARPGWAGGVEGWTEDCLVEVSVKIVPSGSAREAVAPRLPTEACAPGAVSGRLEGRARCARRLDARAHPRPGWPRASRSLRIVGRGVGPTLGGLGMRAPLDPLGRTGRA